MVKSKYSIDGRLEDILTLIQVLGLDPLNRYACEEFLQTGKPKLGSPVSANSWIEIGRQHREFFFFYDSKQGPRIEDIDKEVEPESNQTGSEKGPEKGPRIALSARRANGKACKDSILTLEEIGCLSEVAVKLYNGWAERQDRNEQRYRLWITIIASLMIAILPPIVGKTLSSKPIQVQMMGAAPAIEAEVHQQNAAEGSPHIEATAKP
jgi:hypothetical protein